MEGISGYEWIRPSQIQWYLNTAKELRERNGKIVPALMFFHIPIPEYEQVTEFVGDKQEGIYDANVNSGLFAALKEGLFFIHLFIYYFLKKSQQFFFSNHKSW